MASTYLTRTISSNGNARTWTLSFWVKRSKLGSWMNTHNLGGTGNRDYGAFDSSNRLEFAHSNSGYQYRFITNRVFRDVSAWYHIVIAMDTTQATEANRTKIYVNGVQETSFNTATYPSQNHDTRGSQNKIMIGADFDPSNYFDGLMTHINFTDGNAYAASYFGETDSTTGIWKPKTAPSVTYGTNGFFLKFENSGAMGTDSAGSNNFSVGAGTLTQTIDTPSNVFATMNTATLPAAQVNINKGNLSKTNTPTSNTFRTFYGTIGASSGKYYWELKIDNIESSDPSNFRFGVIDAEQMKNSADNASFHNESRGYAYQGYNGNKANNGATSSYGATFTTGDIIGCAVDLDNHKIYWSKNGTWQNSGDPTSGSTGTGSAFDLASGYTYLPAIAQYYGNEHFSLNFGNGYFGTTSVSSAQNPDDGIGIFEYDVPAGYRSWCTKSLNAEEYS